MIITQMKSQQIKLSKAEQFQKEWRSEKDDDSQQCTYNNDFSHKSDQSLPFQLLSNDQDDFQQEKFTKSCSTQPSNQNFGPIREYCLIQIPELSHLDPNQSDKSSVFIYDNSGSQFFNRQSHKQSTRDESEQRQIRDTIINSDIDFQIFSINTQHLCISEIGSLFPEEEEDQILFFEIESDESTVLDRQFQIQKKADRDSIQFKIGRFVIPPRHFEDNKLPNLDTSDMNSQIFAQLRRNYEPQIIIKCESFSYENSSIFLTINIDQLNQNLDQHSKLSQIYSNSDILDHISRKASLNNFSLLFQDSPNYQMELELENNTITDQNTFQSYVSEVQLFSHLSFEMKRYSIEYKKETIPMKGIGLIYSEWIGEDKKIKVTCYGTAFAISPNIIITCAHSLYDPQTEKKCTRIVFCPGIQEGSPINKQSYTAQAQNIYFNVPEIGNFNFMPRKEDIAAIYLNESLPYKDWLELKSQKNYKIQNHQSLCLFGYPSAQYYYKFYKELQVNPSLSEGYFNRISDEFILFHTMKTQKGFSGSPIMRKSDFKVIGMHTHRGGRGLFFSAIRETEPFLCVDKLLKKMNFRDIQIKETIQSIFGIEDEQIEISSIQEIS